MDHALSPAPWATPGAVLVGHAGVANAGGIGTMQAGQAVKPAHWPWFVFQIFWLNSYFANFKNLHRIHLNSEDYETNFVG
jgi:hypothetical protein